MNMDLQLHVAHQHVDELRDELLRVLVGAVHVVASRDDDREAEGAVVSLHEVLRTCLRTGIWVGGLQDGALVTRRAIFVTLAVHLIGGHVEEEFHSKSLGGFQEHVCTQDIGLSEGEGITEGVVDVRLSCEVHDNVHLLFP